MVTKGVLDHLVRERDDFAVRALDDLLSERPNRLLAQQPLLPLVISLELALEVLGAGGDEQRRFTDAARPCRVVALRSLDLRCEVVRESEELGCELVRIALGGFMLPLYL